MTRSSFLILRALGSVSGSELEIQSPAVIAYNLDYTQTNVSTKLRELTDARLVEKIQDGRYRITSDGGDYLAGELDAEDIPDPTED